MFQLEQAIAEWRRQMLAAGIKSDVLDELEGHLREETGLRMKSGLDAKNALECAMQEIGRPNMIKNEFKKIGLVPRLLEWLMIAICVAFVSLIVFLGAATVVMCFDRLGDRVVAGMAMASTLCVALGWRHAIPFLPVIASAWKRVLVAWACLVLGFVAAPLYFNFILPLFAARGGGGLPAGGLWAVFIIAVFSTLGIGLGMNTKSRVEVSRREAASEASSAV